jgi:nucleoside-diphosphate-sugar epimerase
MSRTVLITGAGGFVGSHMAEGFATMGDAVIALDAAFDAQTRERLVDVDLIEAPLSAGVLASGQTVDLVIHGAAITTPPEEFGMTDEQHVAANVSLLEDALTLAVRNGASDFVFISSSGVFSLEDGEGMQLESTLPTATMPYAAAKRAGETATSAANSATLRAISIRLGPIYGPHEASRSTRKIVSQVRRWLDRVKSGEPIVVQMPDERRDWTFAPDLPRALDALLAIEPKLSGIVHLTSAEIVSNLALAEMIARLVDGSKVEIMPLVQAPRLPISSDRLDLGSLYAWTPLRDGLAAIANFEVAR